MSPDRLDLIYDLVRRVDGRLDSMQASVDQRMHAMDARIDQVEKDTLDVKTRQGWRGLIASTIPGALALIMLVVGMLLKELF